MADEEDELIQRTCGTLQRYYESLNQEYEEGYFVEWCEEFGVDEDLLKEEAKQEAKDSLLAEFDQDTPFPLDTDDLDEEERKVQILEIILKCMWRPNIIWPGEVSLPPCMYLHYIYIFNMNVLIYMIVNARLFVMEESDMNRTKETYCAQCPVLWNAGIYSDLSFLQILAVGLKEKFAYLLHLVDDYNKQRIEKLLKSPTEEDWPEASWSSPHNHRHFKKLHNIKVNILRQPTKEDPDQNKYLTMDYKECAKMAVVSFSKRCCGKMLFNTMMQIDDSIQKFFEYLALTLDFITNLIEDCKKTQKVLCPFMMDVLLAVGAPKFIDQDQTITKSEEVIKDTENKPGVDGSSSESSDDDDECDKYIDNLEDGLDIAKEWVDCIGSVKARLEAQKLSYIKSSIDDSFTFRSLGELFKQFINDNKLKGGKGFPYPYSRRFMILIDRRRPSDKNEEALKEENPDNKYPNSSKKRPEEDGIYIYEPPPGPITRDMPADVVPEWGISVCFNSVWLFSN